MKTNWSLFRKISIFFFIVSSFALMGTFAYLFILNNKKNEKILNSTKKLKGFDHFEWKDIYIPIFDKKKLIENKKEIQREYKERRILQSIPIRMYKNPSGYAMNDNQFDVFVDEIEKKLPYGPEIFGLNIIYINKFEGHYFNPFKGYINIDMETYSNSPSKPSQNDLYIGVLIHEYLHYLQSVYIKDLIKKKNSYLIYDLGGDYLLDGDETPAPRKNYFNKKFLDDFKNFLNYTSTELPTPLKNEKSFQNIDLQGKKRTLQTVASKYPIKWMWDRVNESPEINLKIPPGEEKYFIGSKKLLDYYHYKKQQSIYAKKNYYYYKFSELFARRYTSLLQKEIQKSKPIIRGSDKFKDYWNVTSKDDFRFSGISPLINNDKKWFRDYPYETNEDQLDYNDRRSTKLYNSLRKSMGQYNGSDVSWIKKGRKYPRRNWEAYLNGELIFKYIANKFDQVIQRAGSRDKIPDNILNNILNFLFIVDPNKETHNNKLRMGGYLKGNQIQNEIQLNLSNFNQKNGIVAKLGYKNDSNEIIPLNKTVKIYKYNVKKIDSFSGNNYVELNPNEDKYFWILNNNNNKNYEFLDSNKKINSSFEFKGDYISYEKIKNKKLVIYNENDSKKYSRLRTVRLESENSTKEYGETSTLNYDDSFFKNSKIYLFKEKDGWATI